MTEIKNVGTPKVFLCGAGDAAASDKAEPEAGSAEAIKKVIADSVYERGVGATTKDLAIELGRLTAAKTLND